MRTVIAVLLVAGLAVFGVPHLGGVASLAAQDFVLTVTGQGFCPNSEVRLIDADNNIVARAMADENGDVGFTDVGRGEYTVSGQDCEGNALTGVAAVTEESFRPDSEVLLVDTAGNTVATAIADEFGSVTFSGVAQGQYTLVGVDLAGNALAELAIVTPIAGGTVTAAGVASGVLAAVVTTGGTLAAVGGVLGAVGIAAGAAVGATVLATQLGSDRNVRDVCRLADNVTIEIDRNDPLPTSGHDEGACVASPE